ncbi:hypothetical protein ACFVR2_15255 [Gottfriedia sp. NPDC057991]|uniref:hypothetical protein n=1 Tax=Bacillaceae TaxID=186817 RepID=UPI0006FB3842|nr:hypothetical protein [Bacillus sp. FJAT-25509]KQL41022.1 hypothetical protein AN960_05420 [Bacillus sp. FJAT-25509]
MTYLSNLTKKIKPFFIAVMIGSLFIIKPQNIDLKIILMCILGGSLILESCILSYKNKKVTNRIDLFFGLFLIFFSIFQKIN